jgi:hypothetical protein
MSQTIASGLRADTSNNNGGPLCVAPVAPVAPISR